MLSENSNLKGEIGILRTWERQGTSNSPVIVWRRAFRCSSLKVKMNLKHCSYSDLEGRGGDWGDVTAILMTESGQKSIECGLSDVSEPLHIHEDLKPWSLSCEGRINQCSCKEVAVLGMITEG